MAKTNFYIGVDPGAPLAMAFMNAGEELLGLASYEEVAYREGKTKWHNSPPFVAHQIKEWHSLARGSVKIFMENVGPRPGEGIVSAAKFVGSLWLVKGIAATLDIPVYMKSPASWKKRFGLKGGVENKVFSVQKAAEFWPGYIAEFKLVKHADAAEAALICLFGLEEDQ